MNVLNAEKSSEFWDSRVDEREESAVSVIHGAWLEHSSSLGRREHQDPESPLDMLVLYQAAAATFRDWTPGLSPHEELSQGGQVINREEAGRRLRSLTIDDPQLAELATRFANRVLALSASAAAPQDLDYFVDLFVRSVQNRQVIDGIMSGSICRHSQQLADPDLW
jgi:hypothetical protein